MRDHRRVSTNCVRQDRAEGGCWWRQSGPSICGFSFTALKRVNGGFIPTIVTSRAREPASSALNSAPDGLHGKTARLRYIILSVDI
jgi:hypothetical protein